ncbi:MAG: thioredoxin-disulfide reductase [Bacteroidetes bacterium QS_8_68_15]|nr:MAG: thioredoxin-disulfide reductase [Bacteroidetes bacterium QS_8_68_15]
MQTNGTSSANGHVTQASEAIGNADFSTAEERQVVIIGTGPAGWTAALYTARASLEPLVYQGEEPGGQLMTTSDVENYPGYPEGVLGPQMMDDFEAQATRFGAEVRSGRVTDVDFSERPFRLLVDGKTPVFAQAVIIATGASAKYLGLDNEQRLLGKGVSACATCDGAFFRDQEVAVVGGGDSAMEEALFLTRFASKVHVIHRRDELRASEIMAERAFDNDQIEFRWSQEVVDVLGESMVEGVEVVRNETGETYELPVDGLFIAIGHTPNTGPFTYWLDTDDKGYILTEGDSTHTRVDGVFASGDAQDHVYRQAVTAAGTGCMAAIDAERFLAEAATDSEIDAERTETEYHEAEAVDGEEQAVLES